MAESKNTVQFTIILYGIVASIPLFRITDDLNLRNMMLLFSFFVLATDWMEYQLSVDDVTLDADNKVIMFALDMIIIIIFTFLTVIKPAQLTIYFGIVGLFVLFQAIWDYILLGSSHQGVLTMADLELFFLYSLLILIYYFYDFQNIYLFIFGSMLFIGWKMFVWVDIYNSAKENETIPDL
jgi:hypothetical protein